MMLRNRKKKFRICCFMRPSIRNFLVLLFISVLIFKPIILNSKTFSIPNVKPSLYILTGEDFTIPIEKINNLKLMNIPNDKYIEFYKIFSVISDKKLNDLELSNLITKYVYSDELTHQIIAWYLLRSSHTKPKLPEMYHFLIKNEDWPDTKIIRKKIENFIINHPTKDSFVSNYFQSYPPLTGDGHLALSISKFKSKDYKKAKESYDLAWHKMKLTKEAKEKFINYCNICISRDDNITRFERMLYLGDLDELKDIAKSIGTEYVSLANIAKKLKNNETIISTEFMKIEKGQYNNSIYHYLKLMWLNKKKNTKNTYEYLNKHKNTLNIRNPTLWGVQAEILGRSLISEKKYREAYEAMNLKNTEKNQIFSNLEFLKGWISLRIFNDNKRSINHFEKLYRLSPTDDNKSMALYWIAENLSIMGDTDEEIKYLSDSARFYDTFYGLISLSKLKENNIEPKIIINNQDNPNFKETIDLEKITAIELLTAVDKKYLAAKFINIVFEEDINYNHSNYIANLANMKHLPQTSIKIAKKTGIKSININYLYPTIDFPLIYKPNDREHLIKELIYSIIRQESEFSSEAISYSGAIGIMQIMPSTAKMLSNQEKIKYNQDQLLEDSSYNIQLGSRYIHDLINQFDGSYVYAISAYNAGPSRIKKWSKDYTTSNIIDWIELIPFKETRYYVKNVLRNVQFYKILLYTEDNEFNIIYDLRRGPV